MKESMKFRRPARKATGLFASAAFLAAIATMGWGTSANAAPCLNEAFGGSTSCVSQDIKIASISVTAVTENCDGSVGDTFTFDGTLNIQPSAQKRYDIGFYIGDNPQLSTDDDCTVVVIPPGVSNIDDDQCGDTTGSTLLNVPVTGILATCQDASGDGFFDVNACSGWEVNEGIVCTGPADAVPGSSPKCNCEVVETDEPVPHCTLDLTLCEDNNPCTDEICHPIGEAGGDFFGCEHVNNDDPCDDGLFCNGVDNCAAAGCNGHAGDPCLGGGVCGDNCDEDTDSCFEAAGTLCRATNGVCDSPEECTGSDGACPADDFLSGNTCRASGGVCDVAETCSGSAADCPGNGFSEGNTCRSSNGVCDIVETCSGNGVDCPADDFSSGNTCRATNGICDVAEVCNGSGASCPADDFNEGATCRGTNGVCDVAETCSGSAAGCPTDDFLDGTTCRGTNGVCDVSEVCSGSAAGCPVDDFLDGTICRVDGGVCDAAELCSGTSAGCPADAFTDSGVACRGSNGVCDAIETCTGESAGCPADGFTEGGTCRGSNGVCDVAESCNGDSAACPADGFVEGGTLCRADAGQCDVAENCTGAAAACPADGFENEGTGCALDENPCTDDQCNASGTCVALGNTGNCDDGLFCNGTDTCVDGSCTGHTGDPCAGGGICGDNCQEETDNCFDSSATVCRPSGGICDVAENCTGESGACPSNTFVEGGTCRASNGICDVAESCSGSAAGCPADAFLSGDTCRASGGVCDVAETCSGTSAACPNNAFVTGTTCRSSGGVCDVAETCSGTAATCPNDGFLPTTTVCRADAGDCDVADRCTGSAAACPANGFESNGTACTTDGNLCTNDVCNSSGVCQHNNNTLPCDDGLFCTVGDQCGGGECDGTPRICGDEISCTDDACNESTDSCQFSPDNEECEDEDICTTDICSVDSGCQHIFSCKDICRRFGWWGKRGGPGDGEDSINVVQQILDFYGGIDVCGQHIDETSDGESVAGLGLDSALEGLCVRPEHIDQRTLYRELVATALNCHMSGAGGEEFCDTVVNRFVEVDFSDCSDLCAGDLEISDSEAEELAHDCIEQLDCYNSGGELIGGKCAYGSCDVTGELCGGDYGPCPPFASVPIPLLQVCERFDGNCRDEEFCQEGIGVCPDRLSPTSGRACREAKNNECTIDFCSIDDD